MNIPQDIQDKIIAKRDAVVEEKPKEEVKAPEAETPTKKEEAPTKTNGQSIAQIAEGLEDSAKEDDKSKVDPAPKEDEKPKKKSVFEDLIETKRELKELRKESTENEIALMEDVKTLLAKVDKLEKAGIAPTRR